MLFASANVLAGSFKRFLRDLDVEIVRAKEMKPSEADAFRKHCNRLTIAGLHAVGITTSVGAIIPWFTDFLFFDRQSNFFRMLLIFRSSIVLLTLISLVALRISRTIAANPYYLGLIAFSISMTITGGLIPMVGGFETPFAYGIYTAPMLSIMFFVGPGKRAVATAAILVSFFVPMFLVSPQQLSFRFIGVPLIWSLASAFAAFAAGHVIYLVLRTNFLQRRELADLTNNLQDRVREQTEKIRKLTSTVFEVQEQERHRISHDLHDEMGQLLTRLGMEVEWIEEEEHAADEGSLSSRKSTRVLKGLIDSLHDTLDRVLGALRPILLEKQDFNIVFPRMVQNLAKRKGIDVEVSLEVSIEHLSDTAKTALYRIVQEGMTNIVRHADASHAWISFEAGEANLEVRIRDNGRGFDPKRIEDKNRLGLRGMQERVKLLEGVFSIESKPDEGCEIILTLPLDRIYQEGKS